MYTTIQKLFLTTSKYKLTFLEKTLLLASVVAVSISILLSLCIGLVLPPNFIHKNVSSYNLSNYCLCNKDLKARQLNCLPRSLVLVTNSFTELDEFPYMYYNSYLVSLFINSYHDDNTEKRFACNGVIISSSWILAGQDCITENTEWLQLEVRAGSLFWYTGGSLHRVKRVLYFYKQGPVCLRVYPHFIFQKLINPVKLLNSTSWTVAHSAYWKDTKVKKKNKYYIERWSKTPCKGETKDVGEIRNTILCNVTLDGKPLIFHRVLLAFHVGVCNIATKNPVSYFINFQNNDYALWLLDIVNYGEPQHDGISVKSDEFVTYVYKISDKCITNSTSKELDFMEFFNGTEKSVDPVIQPLINNLTDTYKDKVIRTTEITTGRETFWNNATNTLEMTSNRDIFSNEVTTTPQIISNQDVLWENATNTSKIKPKVDILWNEVTNILEMTSTSKKLWDDVIKTPQMKSNEDVFWDITTKTLKIKNNIDRLWDKTTNTLEMTSSNDRLWDDVTKTLQMTSNRDILWDKTTKTPKINSNKDKLFDKATNTLKMTSNSDRLWGDVTNIPEPEPTKMFSKDVMKVLHIL